MIGIKRTVWLIAICGIFIAGFIKYAVADQELTTLLLASAQVGSSEPSEKVTENITEATEPQDAALAEVEPEVAKPPVETEEETEAPLQTTEEENFSDEEIDKISANPAETMDITPPSEEGKSVPALPSPMPLPGETIAIGEPMKKGNTDQERKMDAIAALKYLLGDLEGLQKRKEQDATQKGNMGDKYLVKPGDTLDLIIENTLSHLPIRKGILRRAFVETNTHAFPSDSPHRLLAGMYIKIPNVEDIRDIIFPKGLPKELAPEKLVTKKPSSNNRKDWVRYP